jgi:DNA-binding CsgD family transcriptional regulator
MQHSGAQLLGRDDELSVLVGAFDVCRRKHTGRAVLVHGADGCGSSALVRALRDALRARGLAHRWWSGRCSRQAPVPYGPVAGLLRDVPGDVADWLGEALPAGGHEAGSVALLAGLARRIRDHAGGEPPTPLVLVVDDADAADPSTLRLLAGVLPLLDDVPVLVVLAARSTDLGAAPHGFDQLCDEVVIVQPLDPEQTEALVRANAPDLDDDAVRAVVAASAGRPSLAHALTTSLTGLGDAERTLAAMLDATHPHAGTAVVAAALADGWIETDRLSSLLGIDAEAWRLLEHRQVLQPSDRTLGAPLAGSQLWVAAARRTLGRESAVAATLAPVLETVAPAAVAAAAWEAAGRNGAAARLWERAADEAVAGHAVETAAVALRRAVELGGEPALLRIGRRAGELSLAAGDREEADHLAARLLPRLDRTDDAGQLGTLLLRYRARLEAGLPEHDAPLDLALARRAVACREHVDVLVVDALRRVLDDPAGAGLQAQRALTEAEQLDDPAAIANAAGAAGLAAAIAGDLAGGLASFDTALAAAARAGDAALEARLASNRVFVLWRAGRPVEVERAAAGELERLRVRGLEALGDQLAVGRVGALLTLGRLGDADVAVAEARALKMAADPTAHLDLADAALALERGETDRAVELVRRVTEGPSADLSEVVGERFVVASSASLARGDVRAAAELASEGLRRCAEGDLVARWRLVLAWWRASAPIDGAPGVAFGDAPSDPADVVGDELAAVAATVAAHRAGTVVAWREAADRWAVLPAPLEILRCGLVIARLEQSPSAIDALADEARAVGAHGVVSVCERAYRAAGGRRAPQRTPGLLTAREVDVLECVAEGLTNKEIAERLYISVRTVGAHLERCMAKLSVGTRGAAVHEARRQGLLGPPTS